LAKRGGRLGNPLSGTVVLSTGCGTCNLTLIMQGSIGSLLAGSRCCVLPLRQDKSHHYSNKLALEPQITICNTCAPRPAFADVPPRTCLSGRAPAPSRVPRLLGPKVVIAPRYVASGGHTASFTVLPVLEIVARHTETHGWVRGIHAGSRGLDSQSRIKRNQGGHGQICRRVLVLVILRLALPFATSCETWLFATYRQ